MRQNPSDADSETYKLKIVTFEHVQPEEFLQIMTNFNRAVDVTWATNAAGKINYICKLLRGEALQYFDKIASQNARTNNTHLKFIKEGILHYFHPIKALSNQKRTMRRAMRKP